MAKQAGIVNFEGKAGELVGYNRKGKRCFRRLPKNVRRSIATMLAGTDFGTASKAAKLIRRALLPALDIRLEHTLTNRLNKELLRILYAGNQQRGSRSIQCNTLGMLKGFQFNENTALDRLLPFPTPKVVQDGDKLRIAIPAMEARAIRHYRNTTHIEIKAIAAGVNFKGGDQEQAISDKVFFDFRKPVPATELVLPFKAGEAETIVVLQVTAFHELDGKIYAQGNKKFFAADIIDVIPSLEEEEEETIVHGERQSLFLLHTDKTYAAPQRE